MKIVIPHAPATLRPLLQRLLDEAALNVSQHHYTPAPDEWFGGDSGPYESAEDAVVGGVRWLRRLYEEAREERDAAERENRQLRTALKSLQAERMRETP
jgi:hypothetical protein